MSIEINLNALIRIAERIANPWVPVSEGLAKLALGLFSDDSAKTIINAIESKVSKDESNTEHFIQFTKNIHKLAISGNTAAIAKMCHTYVEAMKKAKKDILG